jgi:3-hydroxyacyl-CoA dehydrogenase
MKKHIQKVAVIGSGIMGSGIAAHFANIGVEVLLLDIVIPEDKMDPKLASKCKNKRNYLSETALMKALKHKPAPFYHASFASRVTPGNTEDDMAKIADVDWIIEVVVERLDIKQKVFEQVEKHRNEGTLITSNTSGIPIRFMNEGRSEDFQKNFCGTHFFNPARYLKLFEIIPGPKTDPKVIEFLNAYGEKFLGKTSVIAKDTPAFIGNRIGIFGIQSLFHLVKELDMTVEEVDKLTGPVIGRPKSATFRTVDVVGLDTLIHVANGIADNCKKDERIDLFKIPDFIDHMQKENMLGSKTGKGFYQKVKNEKGRSEIQTLDLNTLEYRANQRAKFATLELTKTIDEVIDRFPVLIKGKDKAGEFYRKSLGSLFAYVSLRIPEIADHCYQIDDAMKAGFGWQHGPFQIWQAIGINEGIGLANAEGLEVADWVKKIAENKETFYSVKEGANFYYDIASNRQVKIPGQESFIILDNIREQSAVYKNSGVVVEDLGDGILNVEFRSKMNTLGGDVIQGLNKALDIAEKDFRGLIVGNQGPNFSVGANLAMIFMMAVEQEYEELNNAIRMFQNTVMRMRYSSIPTISAPHGMTFGGGCELSLHADKIVAAAETYMGLVEFGVGVIPGGAGSKEMTLRASDTYQTNDVELNRLREHFLSIAMAKVSTSAYEAYDNFSMQKGKDIVVVNKDRQLAVAKAHAVLMADAGYTKPIERTDIKVLGKQALGMFMVGTDSMLAGNYISEHDKKIANKLAYVMAGGDLSEATLVSERYLLDLEREAFLSLCSERKTLERIQHMLKTGKPLRN